MEFIIKAKQICGTTSSLQLDFARLGHLCCIYDKLKRVRHILCLKKWSRLVDIKSLKTFLHKLVKVMLWIPPFFNFVWISMARSKVKMRSDNFGQANMIMDILGSIVRVILECAMCLQRTHPQVVLDINILLTKSQVYHWKKVTFEPNG